MSAADQPVTNLGVRALFLVWGYPHGSHRSQLMAQELGMDLAHVYITAKKGKLYSLLKYLFQAIKTPVVLARHRPRIVFVQNPPILAALVVYFWGLISGARYIIDSHTDALLAPWWAWSLPLHRFLSCRAVTTLVTNEHLREMVADWGASTFILEDPPATFPERCEVNLDSCTFNIAVVTTASYDEPITQVLDAAMTLPDVEFHVTGNYQSSWGQAIIQKAPANVHFTGYMPDQQFYGLLEAAQAVMSLTTEDHTIQSGASEALWLGKPIITSDWPLLREYFSQGTVHVDNSASSIRRAVTTIRDNLPAFEANILSLQEQRRDEWWQKANALTRCIQRAASYGERGTPAETCLN
jgi:glycosyltransferase involved in cell wall biosynthesis